MGDPAHFTRADEVDIGGHRHAGGRGDIPPNARPQHFGLPWPPWATTLLQGLTETDLYAVIGLQVEGQRAACVLDVGAPGQDQADRA